MRNISKIVFATALIFCFLAGYGARIVSNARETSSKAARDRFESVLKASIASLRGDSGVEYAPVETLYSVAASLKEYYVEQLTPEHEGKMTYKAMQAMLASLGDPNSRFVEPKDAKIVADAMQGKFHGIGAIVGIKRVKIDGSLEERLMVVTPFDGGSAFAAGLKPGDQIIAIDGKSVLPFNPYGKVNKLVKDSKSGKIERSQLKKQLESEEKRLFEGIPIIEAENMLMRDYDKSLALTVVREKAKKHLTFNVAAQDCSPPLIESKKLKGDCAYIKINLAIAGAPEKLKEALDNLNSASVKGLVLDLRHMAGGDLDVIRDIASYFIPGKTLAILKQSKNRKTPVKVPDSKFVWNKPVVAIVGRGTARMAEVLAFALKENHAAKLIGEKTFGDINQVSFLSLSDGSAITLTTGKFMSPKGADYSNVGVPVDLVVESSADGQNQIDAAIKMLDHKKDGG